MTRRLGMDQLVGELLRHGHHEITGLPEKVDVLVIGGRLQSIDLDGVSAPVLKKQPQGGARQSSRSQPLHKSTVRHPLFPSGSDFFVEVVDEALCLSTVHEYSRF